jgi:hypothetical protein
MIRDELFENDNRSILDELEYKPFENESEVIILEG